MLSWAALSCGTLGCGALSSIAISCTVMWWAAAIPSARNQLIALTRRALHGDLGDDVGSD
jgi:hypothetical protein